MVWLPKRASKWDVFALPLLPVITRTLDPASYTMNSRPFIMSLGRANSVKSQDIISMIVKGGEAGGWGMTGWSKAGICYAWFSYCTAGRWLMHVLWLYATGAHVAVVLHTYPFWAHKKCYFTVSWWIICESTKSCCSVCSLLHSSLHRLSQAVKAMKRLLAIHSLHSSYAILNNKILYHCPLSPSWTIKFCTIALFCRSWRV